MPTTRLVPRPPPSTLVVLTGVIVAMGLVEVAMIQATVYEPLWVLLLFVWVGWVSAAAGLLASWRRPSNRLGVILILLGVSWLSAGLYNCGVPALEAVGGLTATLPLAVVVHLLHAFPSGRLVGAVSRLTVLAAYAVSLVLAVPQMLHQPGVLSIDVRPDLIRTWIDRQNVLGAVVMTVTAVVLLRRLRSYDRPQRRVVVPLLSYGVLAVALVPLTSRFGDELLGLTPVGVAVTDLLAVGGVPVAFAFGVLRGGFARTGEIQELGAWLGTEGGARPGADRGARSNPRRPDVELLLLGAGTRQGLRRRGRRCGGAAPPGSTPGAGARSTWPARPGGRDRLRRTLIDEPDAALVRPAAVVIAIAVDHERLTAEVLASREALRESRARIVEAGDAERRRIAQDLHDGLQARLVLLALQAYAARRSTAGSCGCSAELRSGIDTAAAELRALVQGVMPALLIERGLYAAIEDLVDRMPIRHPRLDARPCAGDLACRRWCRAPRTSPSPKALDQRGEACRRQPARRSAGRESAACSTSRSRRRCRRRGAGRGVGLRGMTDRVDVLGGTLRVESSPDHGTRLVRRGAVRVVIGEDEALLREGLVLMLERAGFEVVDVDGRRDARGRRGAAAPPRPGAHATSGCRRPTPTTGCAPPSPSGRRCPARR